MEKKTMKVLDMNASGRRFICIRHRDEKYNPFWVYEVKWVQKKNGMWSESKKLITKYDDMVSVLFEILQQLQYVRK